ncbi:hypothetical protein L1049_017117 [Liquidambar formosana]|uniref:Uncharacterized protein n=1 Tax=Liquidambar formosana TaxID=63359 RepID=A0AAP0X3J3_LIQFO
MQSLEFQESEGLDPLSRLAFIDLDTTSIATALSDHCTMCGGSVKRRSPSSLSLDDPTTTTTTTDSEPKPKRIMVEDDLLVRGFTKISLPIIGPSVTSPSTTIPSASPVLRRCSSDPYNSPGATNNVGAPPNPQSPDNSASKINVIASKPSPQRGNSSALPPLPPTLRRTVSDLTSAAYQMPVTTPEVVRSFSRSSSSADAGAGVQVLSDSIKEESPNSKRLRRMKDRMREMNQWWDEVMREGEDGGSEDNNTHTTKAASDVTETEKGVSVESVGECFSIHFKCPCGKDYQILVSGRNYYYKLT